MFWYRRQLDRDLERWRSRGWLAPEGLEAIRADLDQRGSAFGLAHVLGILGAVLLGFGAITFVAAHWQEMPRLLRLALLIGAMWTAYGLAFWLFGRAQAAFAHAAVLLGSVLYGASIMLVGQMYHMGGSLPDAVLAWGLGTLLAAILLRSNPAFALAILLVGLWGVLKTGERGEVYWWFLVPWAGLGVAVALTTRWRPAFHLLAIGLSSWIIALGWLLAGGQQHMLVTALGLLVMAIAGFGGETIDRHLRISRASLCYGLAIAFIGLFTAQFLDWSFDQTSAIKPWQAANGMPLVVLAAAALALVLAAIYHGLRTGNQPLTWLAYVGFSAELLGVYFKTIGTLMDNALFFLSAGAIVIVLAWLAWRLRERQRAQSEAQS